MDGFPCLTKMAVKVPALKLDFPNGEFFPPNGKNWPSNGN